MLRRAIGLELADEGHETGFIQQYLGPEKMQHTVRYFELTPIRFTHFWAD